MSGLSVIDIVFLIIVGISILMGIIKGFIRELFSLIFLIIGVVLAYLFYNDAGTILMKYVNNKNIANFIGFTAIFTSVLMVGALFTYLIRKILTVGPLKTVDRILGGVFGLLRGILIVVIIVLLFLAFPTDNHWLDKSKFSPHIVNSVPVVLKWFPDHIREKLKFIDKTEINKGHDNKGHKDDREKNN
jgi:membrane protein required for colicin V production